MTLKDIIHTKKKTVAVTVILSVLLIALLISAAVLFFGQNNPLPLVLMYHSVQDEIDGDDRDLFVKPDELEKQIEYLKSRGYIFALADNIYEKYFSPDGNKYVLLTFDDGYENNYTELFPILKKHNVCATVFMIGCLIDRPGYLSSEQIREMSDSGIVSIQTHTASHPALADCTADEITYELTNGINNVYAITEKPVNILCYPYGSYNQAVIDEAGKYFNTAFSTESAFTTPSDNILAIPRVGVSYDYSINDFKRLIYRWEKLHKWYF